MYLSALILVLDQVTKELIRRNIPAGSSVLVWPGYFNLSHIHNSGAAWGVLAGSNDFLVGVSFVALILLVVCRRSLMEDGAIQRVAMACIVGGILGNLVDRIRLGFVVDFMDFHWNLHHFPSFNVADSAISCGVALYLLSTWRSGLGAKRVNQATDTMATPTEQPPAA